MRAALAALFFVAVSAFPAVPVAQVSDASGAKRFVEGLYAAFNRWNHDGKVHLNAYAPALRALIEADEASAPPGEVGALDWDPLCDCQDTDGLSGLHVRILRGSRGHQATAEVEFKNFETTRVTLDLDRIGRHWKIGDVRTNTVPSLVTFLQQNGGKTTAVQR